MCSLQKALTYLYNAIPSDDFSTDALTRTAKSNGARA